MKKQIDPCKICHAATECDGCCKKCTEPCSGGQKCGHEMPPQSQAYYDFWDKELRKKETAKMAEKALAKVPKNDDQEVFVAGDLLPAGDLETVIPRAAVEIQMVDSQLNNLAVFGARLVWRKGQILEEVKRRFTRKGLLALCDHVGITENTANNYIREYQFRDQEFVREIGHNRTVRMLPILEDPSARLEKDKLFYRLSSGEEVEIAVGDVKNMTEEQVRGLVKELKNKDKEILTALEWKTKVEKALKKEQAETARLREENSALKGEVGKSENEVIIERAEKGARDFISSANYLLKNGAVDDDEVFSRLRGACEGFMEFWSRMMRENKEA